MSTDNNMTVDDLLNIEAFGSRLLAGSGGAQRTVLWAHSCELPEPHRWLGPHELLMTVGLCIPPGPQAQVELIQALDAAGIAGMMIGEHELCPQLHPQMLAESDRRGFPLISTAGKVPFAGVARIVAAGNSSRQTQQLLTLNRLYQAALGGPRHSGGLLERLEEIFNVAIAVVDVATGLPIMPGSLVLSDEEAASIPGTVPRRSQAQVSRVGSIRAGDIGLWQLPTVQPSALLVREGAHSMLDSFTLVHLSQVIAADCDRQVGAAVASAQQLGRIIGDALDHHVPPARLRDEAAQLGFAPQEYLLILCAAEAGQQLLPALAIAGVKHSSTFRGSHMATLMDTADQEICSQLFERLSLRGGSSEPFTGLDDARQALLQAQWVLESAGSGTPGLARYDAVDISLTPRSEHDARAIIEKILGPLRGSGASSEVLIETLCAYLDADRSWSDTAQALGVHRQTLGYRLNRIEQLTGRSLKTSSGLAEFWLARVALRQQGLL